MISNYLLGLTSISQWGLFMGIALIIFGWVEKREKLILAGQLVFIFLGTMAAWILLNNLIYVPEITDNNIPKQLKVLAYFKSVTAFMGLTVISILLTLFKIRFHRVSVFILLFFALVLFFMVFNIQQMAG
jgi:hypothetical protein